ncbi:MAG: hypothetical protein K0R10_2069, partial [Alphaproteobacteria bacterium]|nr:hypothetical protein [Alphaproteobacteria bacterium]
MTGDASGTMPSKEHLQKLLAESDGPLNKRELARI